MTVRGRPFKPMPSGGEDLVRYDPQPFVRSADPLAAGPLTSLADPAIRVLDPLRPVPMDDAGQGSLRKIARTADPIQPRQRRRVRFQSEPGEGTWRALSSAAIER